MSGAVRGDLNSSEERTAWTFSGYLMLLVVLALLAMIIRGLAEAAGDTAGPGAVAALVGWFVAFVVAASGFYMLQPNQAAVITLFGA